MRRKPEQLSAGAAFSHAAEATAAARAARLRSSAIRLEQQLAARPRRPVDLDSETEALLRARLTKSGYASAGRTR
ncbi:hypothetical protein GCM10023203_07200 [Actinomycetospora straminea]|uniref:Uncharacterized protein n=1 Tax=Actinomycetospora straminea TaxID=663607 RepID=A0ABP9DWL0_9PSEU